MLSSSERLGESDKVSWSEEAVSTNTFSSSNRICSTEEIWTSEIVNLSACLRTDVLPLTDGASYTEYFSWTNEWSLSRVEASTDDFSQTQDLSVTEIPPCTSEFMASRTASSEVPEMPDGASTWYSSLWTQVSTESATLSEGSSGSFLTIDETSYTLLFSKSDRLSMSKDFRSKDFGMGDEMSISFEFSLTDGVSDSDFLSESSDFSDTRMESVLSDKMSMSKDLRSKDFDMGDEMSLSFGFSLSGGVSESTLFEENAPTETAGKSESASRPPQSLSRDLSVPLGSVTSLEERTLSDFSPLNVSGFLHETSSSHSHEGLSLGAQQAVTKTKDETYYLVAVVLALLMDTGFFIRLMYLENRHMNKELHKDSSVKGDGSARRRKKNPV
jgi:hypothetical protein